jgi:periplasmic protein TonB
MKSSGLTFSFGLSLVCHAIAFGIYDYYEDLRRPVELRSGDLPLTINLVALPEDSHDQLVATAPVAVPAPSVEVSKPQFQPANPLESLHVESVAEPIAVRTESDAQLPLPAARVISDAVTSTPATPANLGDANPQLAGGVRTAAQGPSGRYALPDYRRNPKPVYPRVARHRRQEGLVLLSVKVSDRGLADRVTLKRSSGFVLLDEAALQAVRNWEFEPARIGPLAVASEIEVPIRFQLGD